MAASCAMYSIQELNMDRLTQITLPRFLTSLGGLNFFSWKIAGPCPCVGVVSALQSETVFNLLFW